MFQSKAICILTAGKTVDGRNIDQKIIDDIAQTYDPEVYNARINENHYKWSSKLGSVLSVEKRDNQLFAVLKPNSQLLNVVESGQLLHTSCEFMEDFAGTGQAYLTGLALTDEPASLGTTEIHLSDNSKEKGVVCLSSGATIGKESFDKPELTKQDDLRLLARIKQLFSSNADPSKPLDEENEEMNEELKELLQAQSAQMTALSAQVTSLSATVVELMPKEPEKEEPEEKKDDTELTSKVEALSSKLDDVVTKLSKITDENPRKLAGEDSDNDYL